MIRTLVATLISLPVVSAGPMDFIQSPMGIGSGVSILIIAAVVMLSKSNSQSGAGGRASSWLANGFNALGLGFRGAKAFGKGALGLGMLGKEKASAFMNARAEKAKIEKAEEFDLKIEKQLQVLDTIDGHLHKEEERFDQATYSLADIEKRLVYWEEKIGPYLEKFEGELEDMQKQVNENKVLNPEEFGKRIETVFELFKETSERHIKILERFSQMLAREENIVGKKESIAIKEAQATGEITKGEMKRYQNKKEEYWNELDRLKQMEEAGMSKKQIKRQRNIVSKMAEEFKVEKKEITTTEEEKNKELEVANVTSHIHTMIEKQNQFIAKLWQVEQIMSRRDLTPGYREKLEDYRKKLDDGVIKYSRAIRSKLSRLKNLDATDHKLMQKARKMEIRHQSLSEAVTHLEADQDKSEGDKDDLSLKRKQLVEQRKMAKKYKMAS